MKRVFVFLVFAGWSLSMFSQESSIGIQAGPGWFNMNDFQDFNEVVRSGLPFETKVSNDFPANIVYKAYFQYRYPNRLGLGLKATFSSTGSLVSRADYSGKYMFKNQVHYFSPGIVGDYSFEVSHGISIQPSVELGWEYSNILMQESLTLTDFEDESKQRYTSINLFVEPGLKVLYPLGQRFRVGVYSGYTINATSLLHVPGNPVEFKDYFHLRHNNNSISWTGLRLGVCISYTFKKRNSDTLL
jgi:hypothetical protein